MSSQSITVTKHRGKSTGRKVIFIVPYGLKDSVHTHLALLLWDVRYTCVSVWQRGLVLLLVARKQRQRQALYIL